MKKKMRIRIAVMMFVCLLFAFPTNLCKVDASEIDKSNSRSPIYVSNLYGYGDFPVYVNNGPCSYHITCDVNWLSIYMPKGDTYAKFYYTYSENTSSAPRTANISIIFDNPNDRNRNETFQIIQRNNHNELLPEEIEYTVDSTMPMLSTFNVYVKNGDSLYNLVTDVDWIHVYHPWGTKSAKFYFRCDDNIYNRDRIANITVKFQKEDEWNKNYTFQIKQKHTYVSGRTDKILCVDHEKLNIVAYPDNSRGYANSTTCVYLDSVIALAFNVNDPSHSGVTIDSYNSQYVSATLINTGKFNGTLYYQLKFHIPTDAQCQPYITVIHDNFPVTLSFLCVEHTNDPSPSTSDSTNPNIGYRPSYSTGPGYNDITTPQTPITFSTPNASVQNWEDMMEYIKKWPNN